MAVEPDGDGDRKRRIEELAHLHRLLRHDVREDLSLVLGRIGELREDDGRSRERRIEEMVTASNHVIQLAEAVGDAVEAIRGEGAFEPRPVSLARILRAEVETARSRYAGARFDLEVDEADLEVAGGPLLSAAFATLLGDAVRYTDRETPEIVVSVATDEEAATVRVADDGPGVPEYRRSEHFAAPTDGDPPGASTGRYLVGRLIEGYGGEVGVRNREGRGATVSVTLPLA